MRIEAVSHTFEDYRYRTPITFGGVALDRVTLLNVTVADNTQIDVSGDNAIARDGTGRPDAAAA